MSVSSAGGRLVDEVADRYVEQRCAVDPYTATAIGVAGHDSAVSDLSPDGFAEVASLVRRTLRDAEGAPPSDDRERAARAAMLERLDLEVQLLESGASADLNVVDSPLQAIRQVFDLMPTASEADLTTVTERLARTPGAFAAYRQTLEAQALTLPPARRQVLACAVQAAGWAAPDGSFAALAEAGDAPAALRADLRRAAGDAAAAAGDTARWLRDELAPRARERDAVGRERYTLASRYFLGDEVDLEETYAWGLAEVQRIEAEAASTARDLVGSTSTDQAVAYLDADPARTLHSAESFRDWMQALADRAVAGLAGSQFDIPQPLRRLDCRIAPTHEGSIYYTPPTEDFARAGTMWWSVPAGTDTFSTWRETTTVFHEGVPGHHLQVGSQVYQQELLNRWQRLMCFVSGHGEGWALYAERLMAELGWLDDPGDRLGMLDMQRFRSARVVVDIGMHLELRVPADSAWRPGERWTPELGWEYLRTHSRVADDVLRFELDRYLGWPGQAPSYKVGERIWRAARADAEARHGAAFDLRAWHRAALDLGGLGLGPLREELARV